MIVNNITKQIAESLKAHDEVRLSTLRMLSSALNYEKIAKQHDLSEQEEIAVVRREVKKRKDAVEAYEKAGALERADKERSEIEVLNQYLPPEMDETELEKVVDDAILQSGAKAISDMGKVIGIVMGRTQGQVDGARVSMLVKKKLS